MEAKKGVILLLWLAAAHGGGCFEFPKASEIVNRDYEAYTVYVAQFDTNDDVAWLVCGRHTDAVDGGEFVCSKLAEFTRVSTERYLVHATQNAGEDGWNVRVTVVDADETNVKCCFACKRLDVSVSDRSDDYFVFVKHVSKTEEVGWFVCHETKRHYHQCGGGDYCNATN